MSRPAGKRVLSPHAHLAVVLLALLGFAVLGYLFLVAPKRAESAALDRDIARVEATIEEYASSPHARAAAAVKAAELFKLAKAMPDEAGIADVILELNGVASETGIIFKSIAPQAPEGKNGYQVLPIAVAFRGDFYSLSDFLYRLRTLVRVRDERLSARGRLFSVSSVTFEQDRDSLKTIDAELVVDAYVFTGPATPARQGEEADATAATSTTSTSPPPPAAAPATPSGSADSSNAEGGS